MIKNVILIKNGGRIPTFGLENLSIGSTWKIQRNKMTVEHVLGRFLKLLKPSQQPTAISNTICNVSISQGEWRGVADHEAY